MELGGYEVDTEVDALEMLVWQDLKYIMGTADLGRLISWYPISIRYPN
jgi:hypothetical protein